MSFWQVFLVAALAGAIGGFFGLMLYAVLRVSGLCSDEEERRER